jgi:pyruvate,water dikinase
MLPTFIIDSSSANPADCDRLGGKAATLAAVQSPLANIPAWFIVSPAAITPATQTLNPAAQAEITTALQTLCPNGERVAVRSSAIVEDGVRQSFAGQYQSFLNVPPNDVSDRILEVWQSFMSDRIQIYADDAPTPPAILVQRMVNADVSGIAFSANPVTGQRGVAVISAAHGLGIGLVSGELNGDQYTVDRHNQISITPAEQTHVYRPSDTAPYVQKVELESRSQPCLTDDQARAIANLTRQISQQFCRPYEIEWAWCDRLYLLQARPITTLATLPDPDGTPTLWDNSNIIESYSGITTPLTFSFARRAYEEVYRQFCRLMGVPERAIADHSPTFRRMIGLIRGRVYYNLLSWYRVLALLPGFRVNRRFMEQMMGVREPLPDDIVSGMTATNWRDRLRDSLRLGRTVLGLLWNYWQLPRSIRQFYQRLEQALELHTSLDDLRPDELAAYYSHVEQQLITRWDAPLVNDFFAMVFYGLLRSLCQSWCGDEHGTLQNDLLSHEGGIISAEPARRVSYMASLASDRPDLAQALLHGSVSDIEQAIAHHPDFATEYRAYLNLFGDRCLAELKLESPTLRDNPIPLLRSIGQLAAHPTRDPVPELNLRQQAELQARYALKPNPIRRWIFRWVLRQARHRVRDRENLRFERTRVFGRARQVFRALGRQFYALDLLNQPDDIFYLDVGEILGVIDGTAISTNLRGLVSTRRAEFEHYTRLPAPSDRFSTVGVVHHGNRYDAPPDEEQSTIEQRQGTGCSPGQVCAPVQVITNPYQTPLKPGHILVAEHTDPGWVMLFPSAVGVIVERGSVLSHSAILSREMGLPAVVGLRGALTWLKTDDWVILNGTTGTVQRTDPPLSDRAPTSTVTQTQ